MEAIASKDATRGAPGLTTRDKKQRASPEQEARLKAAVRFLEVRPLGVL